MYPVATRLVRETIKPCIYSMCDLTGLLGQRQQVGDNEHHARFTKLSVSGSRQHLPKGFKVVSVSLRPREWLLPQQQGD